MTSTGFIAFFCITMIAGVVATRAMSEEPEVMVDNTQQLRQALMQAKPGTKILLAPGTYEGGLYLRDIHGSPDEPIILAAADPERPPVIHGGGNCIHFANVSYLELHNLIMSGARGNGLNIDDGGTFETPSHHILLRGVRVYDIGPEGNRDGIKLSGLDDFRIEECIIERWGSGGSGIDMVGCHRGVIQGCAFRHGDRVGGNAVQTKGGSSEIVIRRCRFEHAGSRAINVGGSTGLQFFRPKPQGYEAKDITVEGCTFIGSLAPVAFVGVDGALVRFNTIYRPGRWVLRILQETRKPEFVPSRRGQFTDNIIAFRSDEVAATVNIGPDTAPETFTFARNFWYCLDDPGKSKPDLPAPESDGVYGEDPMFHDAESGDLQLEPDSPAHGAGAQSLTDS